MVQEFQQRLDEITKGPGNAHSPRLEANVVKAKIDELKQEAKECFRNATNPKLDPNESKRAMKQSDRIFDKISTLSENSPPEVKQELEQFQNEFKAQHTAANNIFKADRSILDLKEEGGNKKLILARALEDVNAVPGEQGAERKGILRQTLLRNPELFLGQPNLLENPQFAAIITPRDYVGALMKKVSGTEGDERKNLLQEIGTRYKNLSDGDKAKLPSLAAVSATTPKTTGFRAAIKATVGYVPAASVIQKLNYPENGVAVDDGKGTYTPETVRDAKLHGIIEGFKYDTENLAPEGDLGNVHYTIGSGDIFNVDVNSLLTLEDKDLAVKVACGDLVANPVLTEQKLTFLKALAPDVLESLREEYEDGKWVGREGDFRDKMELYDGLHAALPIFEAISKSDFQPISHDHGVSNPQYHLTLIYDGQKHASPTKELAQKFLDVHQTIEDVSQDPGSWNMNTLHFNSMEEAKTNAAKIGQWLQVELSGTGLFALSKCVNIAGKPYAMFIQSGDCCCGIIGTDGKLRPLMKGSATILSDKVKGQLSTNDELVERYAEHSAAIVKVKPGEEIISLSDGTAEFLTAGEFQTVLSNNQDRKLLGDELRAAVMSKGTGKPDSIETPDVVGNNKTKRWYGGDGEYYDDSTVMLQVVPDKI